MFNPLNLTGRKILVTGASSGIGRGTAIYLSKLGAQLVLTGRNEERLKQTMQELDGKGHSYFTFDLSDVNKIEQIFEAAIKDNIKLNGMVHCAGISFVAPIRTLTPEKMKQAFDILYFCFVEMVRQYCKNKYSDGGTIVAVSSVLSVRPHTCETAYITAKSALNASVSALAFELAKKNIRINGILPGNIYTEMAKNSMQDLDNNELVNNEVNTSLIGRWGTPDDIAAVAAFLTSDMSSFITGRIIYADGGLL